MIEYRPQPVGGGAPVVRLALLVALCLFIVAGAAVVFGASPSSSGGSGAGAAADASVAPTADASAPPASTAPDTDQHGGRFKFGGPGPMGGGFGGPIAGWACINTGAACDGFNTNGPLQITITAIDGSNLSLKTNDGWTRTIDASSATITRGGQKIAVGDLNVGDTVLLKEQRNSDGTYAITAIVVVQPEIRGTVQDVTSDGFTVKQADGTTQAVTVTGSTTYSLGRQAADKSAVKAGAKVDVEGTKSGSTFTATTVSIAPSVLAGTVTAVGANSISITERDGTKATINVTDSTTYRVAGVNSATLSDVKTGDQVIAEGTLNSDGSIDAATVAAGTVTYREFGRPGFRGPGFGGHGPGGFLPFGGNGSGNGSDNPNATPQASPGTSS